MLNVLKVLYGVGVVSAMTCDFCLCDTVHFGGVVPLILMLE